jgi:CRP-like cAMP-binding protein
MDRFSLSDTYLLRGAALGDIDSVQSISEVREFAGGEPILAESDRSQDIMIVIEGRARVTTREGDLIDELRSGEVLGEISFLDGKGRTAHVHASGPCRVLIIPAEKLRELMRKSPPLEIAILRNTSLALCQRLREANQQVESMLVPR